MTELGYEKPARLQVGVALLDLKDLPADVIGKWKRFLESSDRSRMVKNLTAKRDLFPTIGKVDLN